MKLSLSSPTILEWKTASIQFCQFLKHWHNSLPPTTNIFPVWRDPSPLQIVETCYHHRLYLPFFHFAFQFTAFTAVALIHFLYTITALVNTNPLLLCTRWTFLWPLTVSGTVLCSTNICHWKCQTTCVIGLSHFSTITHTAPTSEVRSLSSGRWHQPVSGIII